MNKIVLGAVAVVVLVLGVLLPVGKESKTLVERVVERDVVNSALNSPDLQIGGYRLVSGSMQPIQGTTTILCSIQSPAATSTLVHATVGLTSATTSATFLSLGISTSPYATTTTALALTPLPANTAGYLSVASNTPVLPNRYIVFAQNGGTGILNASGQCEALFAPLF